MEARLQAPQLRAQARKVDVERNWQAKQLEIILTEIGGLHRTE
jgi:hypothetical protein